MTSAAESKEALRRAMRRQRAEVPVEQRRLASETLTNASRSLLLGLSAPIVSGYVPIRAEIDPGALMASMERYGARLALPRVEGDRLAFRLQLPGTPLVPGAYGIGEPAAGSPVVVPDLMCSAPRR